MNSRAGPLKHFCRNPKEISSGSQKLYKTAAKRKSLHAENLFNIEPEKQNKNMRSTKIN